MADRLSKKERSRIMSRIRGKDTAPEKQVRSLLHSMGYRFRLHVKELPGKPDIVLPKHKKVIFVHGCFWHGHEGCVRASRPTTNIDFWNDKINRTIARDKDTQTKLRALGWQVLIIWQCQIRKIEVANRILSSFMDS